MLLSKAAGGFKEKERRQPKPSCTNRNTSTGQWQKSHKEKMHMEITAYNPQKGRLETIEVEYTDDNTTWFNSRHNQDISTITDYEGGLLISENDIGSYPIWIYDISRADIRYDKKKAKQLRQWRL